MPRCASGASAVLIICAHRPRPHFDLTAPDRVILLRQQLVNVDPPQHMKYRRLFRNAFTPKKVDSYKLRFRQVARDIVA